MLELAAAAGEIDLKYLDKSGFLTPKRTELHLLQTRAAKMARTNEEAWSEIKYCRHFSKRIKLCLRFSNRGCRLKSLYQNDGIRSPVSGS